ncbi:MAG TPA: endonuclease/exonuclease/phosphatase family protein [Rhodothermales bacterium]|nr:endonuclease/exonuclease/phosphatase family protein [Rhodothermales bacterium]
MKTRQEAPLILPPREETAPPHPDLHRLRVVSWNVYRNNFPETIEASLKHFVQDCRPDVLLIQEAPVYEVSHFADMAVFDGYFKIYEPMYVVNRPAQSSDLRSVGQLTFSRIPFTTTTAYLLPPIRLRFSRSSPDSPVVRRVALYTRLTLESGKRVGIYNVHLENRALPEGRYKQVRHLLNIVENQKDDVVIVGGDLNTFMTKTFELCLRLFTKAGFRDVFHDDRLRLLPRLDYFMVQGVRSAEPRRLKGSGSDHQPIMADVTV